MNQQTVVDMGTDRDTIHSGVAMHSDSRNTALTGQVTLEHSNLADPSAGVDAQSTTAKPDHDTLQSPKNTPLNAESGNEHPVETRGTSGTSIDIGSEKAVDSINTSQDEDFTIHSADDLSNGAPRGNISTHTGFPEAGRSTVLLTNFDIEGPDGEQQSDTVHLTGFKLHILTFGLTLAAMLMMLNASIVATVSVTMTCDDLN